MINLRNTSVLTLALLASFALAKSFSISTGTARAAGPGRGAPIPPANHTLSPYFTPATAGPKAPDADGFIQRWMLLEPVNEPIRGNTGFTDAFVHNTIKEVNFPDQFTTFPKDGDKLTIGDQELAWHALDSTLFNVKLFRFADGLSKQVYGVMFLAQTIVDSPRDMQNVRLAVGSNSASVWWVNGKETNGLFTDRRMIQDDVVSKRISLKKGPNLIQGAVINGPGMSDMCVRFIDEDGNPVKDITVNLQDAPK